MLIISLTMAIWKYCISKINSRIPNRTHGTVASTCHIFVKAYFTWNTSCIIWCIWVMTDLTVNCKRKKVGYVKDESDLYVVKNSHIYKTVKWIISQSKMLTVTIICTCAGSCWCGEIVGTHCAWVRCIDWAEVSDFTLYALSCVWGVWCKTKITNS